MTDKQITLITKENCTNCTTAKFKLRVKNVPYTALQYDDSVKESLLKDFGFEAKSLPIMLYNGNVYEFTNLQQLVDDFNQYHVV